MIKYNYNYASELFEKYADLILDMPDYLDMDTLQKERRYFMRALTRGCLRDTSIYLNRLNEELSYLFPFTSENVPQNDIETMYNISKLMIEIENFTINNRNNKILTGV